MSDEMRADLERPGYDDPDADPENLDPDEDGVADDEVGPDPDPDPDEM